MPAFHQPPAQTAQPQANAGPASSPGAVPEKRNSLTLAVVIGASVLALAALGAIFAFHKGAQNASSAPSPVVSAPRPVAAPPPAAEVQQADSSGLYTNHYTLETPTFIIKISEARQQNVKNSLEATYEGMSKGQGRRIVISGSDTYSTDSNGNPGHFLGWTFVNATTIYFVSLAGDLKVTQGTDVLVSEKGKWKQKPKNR